jgi:glycine cleavage system protein P-like pyridoxal-binding family
MLVSEIELFEILSQQLGKEKAKSLVEYVETKIEKRLDEKTNVFATKEDLANTKADLIKWMFIFWIGSVGVISGMMVAILNAYLKH